jgi:DNA-binding SARP family transcriptional activator
MRESTAEMPRAGLLGRLAGTVPLGAPAPGPRLRLVLLGLMEAWGLGGLSVLPRGRKARGLLAVLALAQGAAVPRLHLAELLWSRRGAEQQRASLRQALRELQLALAPAGAPLLQPRRTEVALGPAEALWVDVQEALRPSAAALALPVGEELLADLDGLDPAFDTWLADQRARLSRMAAEQGAARLEAAQGPDASIAAAGRLLAIDPANEGAWRRLLRAELERGDRCAALAAYDACRKALAKRFGTTPSPETEALARALRADPPPAAPAATPAAARRAGQRGARLGVAPLRLLGEGSDPALSAGLAEEITAALTRFRWMHVVDSASLAAATEREGEAGAAAALGLDFLLSGSVQRGAAGRLRISLRLTDQHPPGGVAWMERFDREAGDILALQDEIAAEVVARIDPEILLIEAGRAGAATRGAVNASAYGLLLRAIPAMHRMERVSFLAAGEWLAEATALEPDYAPAQAWHAYWHLFLVGQGWAEDSAGVLAEAERLAGRAIALDPLDAQALTILGHVRAFLHHRVEEAALLHERALALNPNLAMAWVFAGMAQSYLGAHEAGLVRLDRYRRLAPCHPHAFFFDAGRGIPLLFLHRHAEAVKVGRSVTALQPGFSYPYKTYLSALGHLGLMEEAAQVRAQLLSVEPDFCVEKALRRTPARRPVDRAHYERGLRLAGLR